MIKGHRNGAGMEEKWQKTQIHRTITETVTDRTAQVLTTADRMVQVLTTQVLTPQATRPLISPQIRHPMHPDRTAQVLTTIKHPTVTENETTA